MNETKVEETKSGFAVASLVCGIISLVFAWLGMWLSLAGIILGILAIVFSVLAKKKNDSRKGIITGGLVCGIIGLVLSALLFIACSACTCAANKAVDELNKSVTEEKVNEWLKELEDSTTEAE